MFEGLIPLKPSDSITYSMATKGNYVQLEEIEENLPERNIFKKH